MNDLIEVRYRAMSLGEQCNDAKKQQQACEPNERSSWSEVLLVSIEGLHFCWCVPSNPIDSQSNLSASPNVHRDKN